MKVQASVKRRCPNCEVIVRKKRIGGSKKKQAKLKRDVYIKCTNPRHNQRQG